MVKVLFVDKSENLRDDIGFSDVLEGEMDGFEYALIVFLSPYFLYCVPGNKGLNEHTKGLVIISNGQYKNNRPSQGKHTCILKEEPDILKGYFVIELQNQVKREVIIVAFHVQEELDDFVDIFFGCLLQESLDEYFLNSFDFFEIDLEEFLE